MSRIPFSAVVETLRDDLFGIFGEKLGDRVTLEEADSTIRAVFNAIVKSLTESPELSSLEIPDFDPEDRESGGFGVFEERLVQGRTSEALGSKEYSAVVVSFRGGSGLKAALRRRSNIPAENRTLLPEEYDEVINQVDQETA